jgi:thiamine pyrophosphokinase
MNSILPIIQDFRTVILANGAFPTHDLPLSFLKNAQQIVCCDGATQSLLDFGLEPTCIVGDLDSISAELKMRYSSILYQNTDQEINDLTKAVQLCLHRGWTRITIVGATGNREDHTLGNISLLADYAEDCEVQLLTDYGAFTAMQETISFESYPKQQVSLFSLTNETRFTTQNLRYPLNEQHLSSWWMGTLNEALGDTFSIKIDSGRVLVFRKY